MKILLSVFCALIIGESGQQSVRLIAGSIDPLSPSSFWGVDLFCLRQFSFFLSPQERRLRPFWDEKSVPMDQATGAALCRKYFRCISMHLHYNNNIHRRTIPSRHIRDQMTALCVIRPVLLLFHQLRDSIDYVQVKLRKQLAANLISSEGLGLTHAVWKVGEIKLHPLIMPRM